MYQNVHRLKVVENDDSNWVIGLDLLSNGREMGCVNTSSRHQIGLIDLERGCESWFFNPHKGIPCDLSHDGSLLVSCCRDNTISLLDCRIGPSSSSSSSLQCRLPSPSYCTSVSSSCGLYGLVGCDGGDIWTLDWRKNGRVVSRWEDAHVGGVTSVRCNNTQLPYVVTGGADGVVCVWKINGNNNPNNPNPNNNNNVNYFTNNIDDDNDDDDDDDDDLKAAMESGGSSVSWVMWGNNQSVICATHDGDVMCWNEGGQNVKWKAQRRLDQFSVVSAWDDDTPRAMWVGRRGSMTLAQCDHNGPEYELRNGHTQLVRAAQVFQQGQKCVSAGEDGYICFWQYRSAPPQQQQQQQQSDGDFGPASRRPEKKFSFK